MKQKYHINVDAVKAHQKKLLLHGDSDIRVKSQLSDQHALIWNNNFINFCVATKLSISLREISTGTQIIRDSQ